MLLLTQNTDVTADTEHWNCQRKLPCT